MSHPPIERGQRFGLLVVIGPAVRINKNQRWLCACDCGREPAVMGHNLKSGASQSCGCQAKASRKTHGFSTMPEYTVWRKMLERCNDEGSPNFKRYGARGIRVSDKWSDFTKFLEDMGERPSPAHSIERNNNDGHYEPGNCRWATRSEQARNRRSTRTVEFDGRSMSLKEACELAGLSYSMVKQRLRAGWTAERALARSPLATPEPNR